MKQFSLDEYLKNPSKQVVTREGKNVRIVCTDRRKMEYPIVALIENEYIEDICWYSKDGRLFPNDLSFYDLFFAHEKPNVEKFDPKTLHPFDKVLVRNHSTEIWQPNFFGYINDENPKTISCFGFYWDYCIPYNEETKHLVGTSDDCPEYYKWWEK